MTTERRYRGGSWKTQVAYGRREVAYRDVCAERSGEQVDHNAAERGQQVLSGSRQHWQRDGPGDVKWRQWLSRSACLIGDGRRSPTVLVPVSTTDIARVAGSHRAQLCLTLGDAADMSVAQAVRRRRYGGLAIQAPTF